MQLADSNDKNDKNDKKELDKNVWINYLYAQESRRHVHLHVFWFQNCIQRYIVGYLIVDKGYLIVDKTSLRTNYCIYNLIL